MRVLIYGAGVIGGELAHVLARAGNDVTVLARGQWKAALEKKGLIVRHYVQLRTTTDYVRVIERLEPDDQYDLLFVVMQFGQLPAVLPIVARNSSSYIVAVGNNPDAENAQKALCSIYPEKEIAFGFQGSGGRRESGRIVSVHLNAGMTVGALHGELSSAFQTRLDQAFAGAKYRLTPERDMDACLKCHLAFILPAAYVCYSVNCQLPRATKQQLWDIVDAGAEANAMLKSFGYPIRPDGQEALFTEQRKKCYRLLHFMAKTPLGRLAASDHCRHAEAEMQLLDDEFEKLREKAGMPMPTWDRLREQGRPVAGAHF